MFLFNKTTKYVTSSGDQKSEVNNNLQFKISFKYMKQFRILKCICDTDNVNSWDKAYNAILKFIRKSNSLTPFNVWMKWLRSVKWTHRHAGPW